MGSVPQWGLAEVTRRCKLCEFRGTLSETILSQAPRGEGATTIPQGSRAKRSEAHGTQNG